MRESICMKKVLLWLIPIVMLALLFVFRFHIIPYGIHMTNEQYGRVFGLSKRNTDLAEIKTVFGEPDSMAYVMRESWCHTIEVCYEEEGLLFRCSANPITRGLQDVDFCVSRIEITNEDYVFGLFGAHVGSTKEEIEKIYGELSKAEDDRYSYCNFDYFTYIEFVYDENDVAERIIIGNIC